MDQPHGIKHHDAQRAPLDGNVQCLIMRLPILTAAQFWPLRLPEKAHGLSLFRARTTAHPRRIAATFAKF